mgnify:CR=1 FL=1
MLNYFNFLRPYHWIKNTLVFIPMLASHQINELTLKYSILAFISFSLIASCGYIFNDIVDLKSDKLHPYKKNRLLASKKVTKLESKFIMLFLLIFAFFISSLINIKFSFIILIYFLLSLIYSINLKKKIILDIIILSLFYALRIFGGSQATDIFISPWLISFSIFFFFSLSAMKRQAELVQTIKHKKKEIKGRGYRTEDLNIITSIALSTGYLSIAILAFYINSEEVLKLYSNSLFLWGVCFVLFYWITKIIFAANRGLIYIDPVIYAVTDKISYFCGIVILFFIIMSII